MALLAGPKRKQKIGIDPNNTNWANDSSAFGQSLLRKMGWKEGKGLGANEDGRIVPVKASLKIDNKGLGCTAKDADAWIAHREEFDDILAALNASSNTSTSNTETSVDGLEEKTEQSIQSKKAEGQKRFYGRFSRGGVKTLRTTEDLDCIMGRRKTSIPPADNDPKMKAEDNLERNLDKGDDDENDDEEVEKSHGFVTTTSTCSIQDYFAQKLKNKNVSSTSILNGSGESKESEKQDDDINNDCGSKKEKVETESEEVDFECKVSKTDDSVESRKRKKSKSNMYEEETKTEIRKKKRKKEKNSGNESDEKNVLDDEEAVVISEKRSKKAKKKRKNEIKELMESVPEPVLQFKKSNEEIQTTSCDVADENEDNNTLMKKKKKGKKKKKKSLKDEDLEKSTGEEMKEEAAESDESLSPDAAIEDKVECDQPQIEAESELLQKTENMRKKMLYKAKKVILKKLEGLKVLNNDNWLVRMNSLQEKASKDFSSDTRLGTLRVKVLDNILQKIGDMPSKQEQMKDCKIICKIAVEESQGIVKKAILELKALETTLTKKINRKTKKKISAINKMASEEQKKSNIEIDWKDAIASLENAKKSIIADMKTTRKRIIEELKTKMNEFSTAVKKLERSVAAKMERVTSTEKMNPVFPGAIKTEGYEFTL